MEHESKDLELLNGRVVTVYLHNGERVSGKLNYHPREGIKWEVNVNWKWDEIKKVIEKT